MEEGGLGEKIPAVDACLCTAVEVQKNIVYSSSEDSEIQSTQTADEVSNEWT